MPDELPADRQRAMLRDLTGLVADRAASEKRIKARHDETTAAAQSEFASTSGRLKKKYKTDREALEEAHRATRERLESGFTSERDRLQREFESSLVRIKEKAEVNRVATRKALQEALWLTDTVYEANESQPNELFQTARKGVDGKREALDQIEKQAQGLLKRYRQTSHLKHDARPTPSSEPDGMKLLDDSVDGAQKALDGLQGLFVPRFFESAWPVVFFLLVAAAPVIYIGATKGWAMGTPMGIAAGAGMLGAALLLVALFALAKAKVGRFFRDLQSAILTGRDAAVVALRQAEETRERTKSGLVEQRDRDLAAAKKKYEPVLVEIEERLVHHQERINEKYPALLDDLQTQFNADHAAEMARFAAARIDLQDDFDRNMAAAEERQSKLLAESEAEYRRDWDALEDRWKRGMTETYAAAEAANRADATRFPAWDDPSWETWSPPADFAPAIRFGSMHVDLEALPGGLPEDPRLHVPGPKQFDMPALLAFPNLCSMLIEAGSQGRDEAVQALQTVMFRLLATIPPGKVRFTIIDPVGLGQNFAGFMHLADFDGALVTDKIWTEDRHIEQRLLDLTEHMENVIQKYLRNEYQTIGDYNVDAGEIAEPFRFLVIANFPVNFSETAARRLASVVNSGARCGVYTLITVDTRQPLPVGIQMGDLERDSVRLAFDPATKSFKWKDEDVGRFPLTIDEPPAESFITEKLHAIGAAAKDSSRVEVPFDIITPAPEEIWSLSTASDVHVPLGRAGATKLQYLTLGVGTSQHALVAGKTGSGKSTLLHALITNLALWYSPQEIEFYLVDFKKGVEFKTYATYELPHARAVAIESDREFGLSVLQRLDAELKHRGNLYRDLGVQDLAGYRRSGHPEVMPRILLIVDEFQEIFIEDDKLGQDAALLLDRLVRQGRAFGMHVLLGSQTLGGAYSLARSTIGQMGVRIALQCSEADSYLILSDDNAAARLLSRPGEAIYNDASGMVEGNNPFQIVWLPEDVREAKLKQVHDLAKAKRVMPAEPQIVFEGNVPADLARNHLLDNLLHRRTWPAPPAAASAWLGEAIAIKDPTASVFRRHSGNNLLIVGQREEAALAMMTTSLLSLAAQHAPGTAKFFILDGTPADSPATGYLAKVAAMLPHQVRNVAWREVGEAINEIAVEVDRRTQAHESDAPAIYLFVYGLPRFRMLRQEDDYGFSSSSDPDAPPRPEKQFGQILREGAAHGAHALVWCDTVNNLNRCLDRQGLKEFEIRVLFQMGASDSSNLIDSPLASKLGLHRALFFSEEQGYLEKFRPYALPDETWLAEVARRMSEREGADAPVDAR